MRRRAELVALSYYWEAEAQDHLSDDETARLYGLSLAAGSSWAAQELASLGSAILSDPDDTRRDHAAFVPLLRQLVTERVIDSLAEYSGGAQNGSEEAAQRAARWLDSVKSAGVDTTWRMPTAWRGLRKPGRLRISRVMVEKGSVDSAMALWLRAKLALRSGHEGEAARLFSQALKQFSAASGADYIYTMSGGSIIPRVKGLLIRRASFTGIRESQRWRAESFRARWNPFSKVAHGWTRLTWLSM